MRNARAHKLQWSDPTVHSSTVALLFILSTVTMLYDLLVLFCIESCPLHQQSRACHRLIESRTGSTLHATNNTEFNNLNLYNYLQIFVTNNLQYIDK